MACQNPNALALSALRILCVKQSDRATLCTLFPHCRLLTVLTRSNLQKSLMKMVSFRNADCAFKLARSSAQESLVFFVKGMKLVTSCLTLHAYTQAWHIDCAPYLIVSLQSCIAPSDRDQQQLECFLHRERYN